jgi:hypothetical protein
MEATCSSETSIDFQRAAMRYILEDRTLHKLNPTAITYKKFWEELIIYFPWYDAGHIENDASNISSIFLRVYSLPW